ncbi:MAG: site-specific integrase [Candidatus Acididesulfobacter guangdongensis]|uniref:Site-specific integrase n=1 Tax=Acididesulfobacter guangdongensis TaxID=2597225 RepID=A0A519BE89_ACIG2|nr:MAG: site-specific integrase [Candidatus Acididesulfobacter guangdongensis]
MRIYKRGNIYWTEFEVDNKRYQMSTKTKDKKLAQEIAAALQADTIRNKFNIPQKYKVEKRFKEAWEEYVKSLNVAKSTLKSNLSRSKHFIFFYEKNIKDITQLDLKNYQLKRKKEILAMPKNLEKREQDISFKEINHELQILRNFFSFCILNGYLDKNPAAGIKKLNELSRLKTLSDSDIDKLIAGATNKLTRDLITFLIYTGCRKGEALNLKWDDVDMQNDVIAIKGTKTKYDRYIPISKPLKELLSRIEKVQDVLYVFNRNGAKLTDFKRSFHTACKNAGLKDMHIHDLRHVFASKMVMNGTSLFITGELLGHRTTQMTKRYSHLVPSTLRKAVDDVWNKDDKED